MTLADPRAPLDPRASGLMQARENYLFNLRQQLQAALGDLARIREHAAQGNRLAAYQNYVRRYHYIEQLCRGIYAATGEESLIPRFDPPPLPGQETELVRVGAPDPLAMPEPPPPPPKRIPKHIKPGTAAWYRIQGQTPPEGVPE